MSGNFKTFKIIIILGVLNLAFALLVSAYSCNNYYTKLSTLRSSADRLIKCNNENEFYRLGKNLAIDIDNLIGYRINFQPNESFQRDLGSLRNIVCNDAYCSYDDEKGISRVYNSFTVSASYESNECLTKIIYCLQLGIFLVLAVITYIAGSIRKAVKNRKSVD